MLELAYWWSKGFNNGIWIVSTCLSARCLALSSIILNTADMTIILIIENIISYLLLRTASKGIKTVGYPPVFDIIGMHYELNSLFKL